MKDNKERETFRKNLNYFVERSGKTQAEICEGLGEATSTFNNWLQGNSAPNLGKVQKIADYFGVTKAALLEEYSELQPSERYAEVVAKIGVADPESRDMIVKYYSLTADDKKVVRDIVRRLGK